MKLLWYCIFLLLTGCYTNSLPEPEKDGFYKLYGNGTLQEATAMEFTDAGDVYILGNQYVRNQDSSAVLLMRTDAIGNQLWSGRYFGKGYSISKDILILSSGEVLLLASSRPADADGSIPVLYHLNDKGELLNEFFIRQQGTANSAEATLNYVPQDMVAGENGHVFIVGNLKEASGKSLKSFILKVDPASGEVLDEREFSNSEMTEVKRVFLNNDKLILTGNTWQEVDEARNQNLFLASFSTNLIEAQHTITGSSNFDAFKNGIINFRNELVIISTEESQSSGLSSGVVRFLDGQSLQLKHSFSLDYSSKEVPETIAEDEEGNYFVAVNSFGERGRSNIILNRIDPFGAWLWDFPREIGGGGSDKIAQVKIRDQYVYLLSTMDMQNENTLICLSRIKF